MNLKNHVNNVNADQSFKLQTFYIHKFLEEIKSNIEKCRIISFFILIITEK